jgi:hypothetical protein
LFRASWSWMVDARERVGNGLRGDSIRGFLNGLWLVFQREKSKGLDATYHFTFTGAEDVQGTVVIGDQRLEVKEGHVGKANIRVTADSRTWLGFLAKERSLVWTLLRHKIRVKGSPRWLPWLSGNAFRRERESRRQRWF